EQVLQDIAEYLQKTEETAASGNALKTIINQADWAQCGTELENILSGIPDDSKAAQPWAGLIRSLLRQLDMPHKGLTVTRKKEGLETVLTRFGNKPEVLFEKMGNLVRSWSESPVTDSLVEIAPALLPGTPASPPSALTDIPVKATPAHTIESATAMLGNLSELLAQTLESTLSTQPELSDEVLKLATQVRSLENHDQVTVLAKQLRQFWLKAELRGGDKIKIQEGLVRLLRLLVE
ncbi:MAG: GGDEF domain-containing protein, partial [Gallionellales bacterium CG_4_10_14_3_um_filter_54_96]